MLFSSPVKLVYQNSSVTSQKRLNRGRYGWQTISIKGVKIKGGLLMMKRAKAVATLWIEQATG